MTLSTDLDKRGLIYDTQRLDLTKVMAYARAQYQWWDDAKASEAATAYRNFLYVAWVWSQSQYKDKQVSAISALADQVWHCHLLLPVDYRSACGLIFGEGKILDHQPELGDRQENPGEWDLVAWAYGTAGLTTPTDLHPACVWPSVH